jgi:Tol biopolymer transport system component/dienelactone hydrolase
MSEMKLSAHATSYEVTRSAIRVFWNLFWICTAIIGMCGDARAQSSPAASNTSPISILDTLSMTTVDSIRMSPDGHTIAYVTHIADLATNKNRHTLAVIDATGKNDRLVMTADDITSVVWTVDSRTIFAIAKRDSLYSIIRVDPYRGRVDEVTSNDGAINQIAISQNGGICAYTTTEQADMATAERRKEEGMVYRWGIDSAMDIINRGYTVGDWEDFYLVHVGTKTKQLIYRLKYGGSPNRAVPFVDAMRFSPDGARIAVSLTRMGDIPKGQTPFNSFLGVLDVKTREFTEPAPEDKGNQFGVAWSADSRQLLFLEGSGLRLYDTDGRKFVPIDWAVIPESNAFAPGLEYDRVKEVAILRTTKAVYKFDFAKETVHEESSSIPLRTGDAVSDDEQGDSYAFLDQSTNRRPQIAICNMKTSEVRRLTNLNSWLDRRTLGRVEKMEVSYALGSKVTGYLVYPVGYVRGKRYPLIVGTYGFRGEFIVAAEWHTTFPAQTLAGQGYAVLLLNIPPIGQSLAGDQVKAREMEGWQALSTFENAIESLVAKGVVDPERVGLYGWSHGVFVVEFLLAHSKLHFRAAEVGEGGDYNPGGYWIGGTDTWPHIYQNIYGGPLSLRTAKAYFEFSPALNVDHIDAPLLMEFSGKDGFAGLEFYVPLKLAGKPVELVTYDDEPHNFVTPRARLASMGRKVDWFNYWMLGKKDPVPSKADQYERWEHLKELQNAESQAVGQSSNEVIRPSSLAGW